MTRRAKWRSLGAIAFVLSVALVVVVGAFLFRPPIAVTFANESSAAVSNVMLEYTGGTASLGTIPPGASSTRRIRATGDSHLFVAFVDGKGNKRQGDVDCYFGESGYRGSIEIRLTESGKVETEDHINVSILQSLLDTITDLFCCIVGET